MNSQHVCKLISLAVHFNTFNEAHGAIMARALDVGIVTSPCFDEAVPMGVDDEGTSSSQPSSCLESAFPLSVYHEPA